MSLLDRLADCDFSSYSDVELDSLNAQLTAYKADVRALQRELQAEVSRRQALERQAQTLAEMHPEVREQLIGEIDGDMARRMQRWAVFRTEPDG